MKVFFLKFVISDRGSHCDYPHRALENPPTALQGLTFLVEFCNRVKEDLQWLIPLLHLPGSHQNLHAFI